MILSGLESLNISGKEVYPIIEGGKGVAVSTGVSAGHFANAGAVGTFSGVNAQRLDNQGNIIPLVYKGKTRLEKHYELMQYSVKAAVDQAKVAYDIASNKGRIHMNLLWEAAGTVDLLHQVLEKTKGMIHGITCGAGMPYKMGPIAEKYNIFYYPIVSSMRAFRALWKRSYSKHADFLGGIVYEDPWKAGGHNGLSNAEDPTQPERPYERLVEIRKFMNEVGLEQVPIIMAGGVWHIKDYSEYLDNKEIGKIAFQLGTRPILTTESPVPESWKKKLLTLKEGDVFLNRFSPTGFYSSAVNNNLIQDLHQRSQRQVAFSSEQSEEFSHEIPLGARNRVAYVKSEDASKVNGFFDAGFNTTMKTPDNTLVFVTKEQKQVIHKDQVDCMGCLTACKFSNWMADEERNYTTGRRADPRSFCIQKSLQDIIADGDVENELMFAGHNAYMFAKDEYYKNGFVPTTKQLVERLLTGN
jgi:nitronate monooxygenase